MERLKTMKETLVSCVEGQLCNLQNADTQELGAAVDMIKDLSEAIYYCTITKSMEEAEKEEKEGKRHSSRYYEELMVLPPYYCDYDKYWYPYKEPRYYHEGKYRRDMDRNMGRIYYDNGDYYGEDGYRKTYAEGNGGSSQTGSNGDSSRMYHEREYPLELRDEREGRSPKSRRMYMESKEMHKNKEQKMHELENYLQELTTDVMEMIEDTSPEEKQLLSRKMTSLASKISQLNG